MGIIMIKNEVEYTNITICIYIYKMAG